MRLGSPIVIFTVAMTGVIIAILLSFALPVWQVIAAPLILIGSWLMLLGLTQRAKAHEFLATTPMAYVVYGGLMITISATYLIHTSIQEVRFTLLVFIVGIMVTFLLSHVAGTRKAG